MSLIFNGAAMHLKQTVFTHPSQLNHLRMGPLLRTKGIGRIVISGEMEQHPARENFEAELNRRYYACGCELGAAGLLIGLVVSGGWQAYRYFSSGGTILSAIGMVLLVAVIGAVAGKFIGMLKASRVLRQTVQNIQKQWQVDPPPQQESWDCG